MHFRSVADTSRQGNGKGAAQMFLKFPEGPADIHVEKGRMEEDQIQVLKQLQDAVKLIPADHIAVPGIEGIKGYAYGYRLPMINFIPGNLLKLVS